ncbi:MAG: hypothetical protein U1F43_21310 [Myxococcota bacterium]
MLDDALLMAWNVWARARFARAPAALRELLHQNRAIQGLHRGERCWIIGNGPSLRDQDLTRLRGEQTFVVNRFIHHPDAEAIDPKYYVVVDPKFGAGAWGTDFVRELERRLPDVSVFTSAAGRALLDGEGLLQRHRRFVVHPNQFFAFGYPWDIDLTRGIPGMDNVTKTALSIAVWMGFTRVNLIGIDGNGLLLDSQSHFYGHEPRPSAQEDLEKALVSSALSLRGWRAVTHYLAARGVELVSQNPRSVLTAMPYEPFNP